MSDIDFNLFLDKFMQRPILLEQEALIVSAMIEGTITKNTAKELYVRMCEHNMKKMEQLMSMSQEEIFELMDSYGVRNEVLP